MFFFLFSLFCCVDGQRPLKSLRSRRLPTKRIGQGSLAHHAGPRVCLAVAHTHTQSRTKFLYPKHLHKGTFLVRLTARNGFGLGQGRQGEQQQQQQATSCSFFVQQHSKTQTERMSERYNDLTIYSFQRKQLRFGRLTNGLFGSVSACGESPNARGVRLGDQIRVARGWKQRSRQAEHGRHRSNRWRHRSHDQRK